MRRRDSIESRMRRLVVSVCVFVAAVLAVERLQQMYLVTRIVLRI